MSYSSPEFSRNCNVDIDIIVNEKVFSTHKNLLIKHSPYLKEKLEGKMKYERRIVLENIDDKGFEWCIEYMYSKECPPRVYEKQMNFDHLTKALQTANFLGMVELADKCQELFCNTVGAKNGLDLVVILRKHGSGQFVRKARRLVKNSLQIATTLKGFVEINESDFLYYITKPDEEPSVIWEAIQLWMGKNDARLSRFHKAFNILLGLKLDIIQILPAILDYCLSRKIQDCYHIILREFESHHDKIVKMLDPKLSIDLITMAKFDDLPENGLKDVQTAAIEYLAQNITVRALEFHKLEFDDFVKVLRASGELTNERKWSTIVAWVQHLKSRQKYLVELIMTMDLPELTNQYISAHMESESIVESSQECLRFLRNLRLNAIKQEEKEKVHVTRQTTLAILDDGKRLVSLFVEPDKPFANIPLPKHISDTARIASHSDKLYLHYNGHIEVMKDGSWISAYKYPNYARTWDQFISFGDNLVIITKDTAIIFEPEKMNAKRIKGPMLGTGFSSIGTDSCIFAIGGFFSSDKARKYTDGKGWVDLPDMPVLVSEPASAYFKQKLYVMGGCYMGVYSSTVTCFDGKAWFKVPSMLHRRSRVGAAIYKGKLYIVGGKSAYFDKSDIFEEYTGQHGGWKRAGRIDATQGILSLAQCVVNTSL